MTVEKSKTMQLEVPEDEVQKDACSLKQQESSSDVYIDREKGLTYCGGSEDFWKEIISMYAADDKRTEIQKAYDEQDWDGYRILIHTVKSTSRTIGAMELGDEAQTLETAVKEHDLDSVHTMHGGVMDSYSAVLDWCHGVIQYIWEKNLRETGDTTEFNENSERKSE